MPKRAPEKALKKKAVVSSDKAEAKRLRRRKNVKVGQLWYKYQSNWARAEKTLKQKRNEAKEQGTYFLEPEAKVLVVTRVRGINRMSPKVRKVLRLLRLRQLHNTVFIKVNKATIGMLKLVEPYIAYGYPSVSTIKKMICKRGYLKVNRQRIPLVSNEQVDKLLGEKGIVSIGCMINEIFTCGPNFSEVTRHLWPFKLSAPKGGYRMNKRIHFVDGGTHGNHEVYINNYLAKMI